MNTPFSQMRFCPIRTVCLLMLLMLQSSQIPVQAENPKVICSGEAAGGYAAFPDVCRLKDGSLLCVFYAGYSHVSLPAPQCPLGGRITAIRSTDEGKTWSDPVVMIDTAEDDRDPSIVQLNNGDLLCNWFTYRPSEQGQQIKTYLSRSKDLGKTWSEPRELALPVDFWLATSSPVRQLADGSLILGLYHETDKGDRVFGATAKSRDDGLTWGDYAPIGDGAGVHLDAETDVIPLKNGNLFAALRSSRVNMHCAQSSDMGKTWGPVKDIGFKGHCPYLYRHSSGLILLGVRIPATSIYWSTDETATWKGPLQVDAHTGAYPSMTELPDGQVLFIYYEEGEGSGIRAAFLKVQGDQVEMIPSE